METLTCPENPFSAVMETVRFCDNPGAICTLAGVALTEKSGEGGGDELSEPPELLPPHELRRLTASMVTRK
jgi:hypothetical protein